MLIERRPSYNTLINDSPGHDHLEEGEPCLSVPVGAPLGLGQLPVAKSRSVQWWRLYGHVSSGAVMRVCVG